MSARPAVQVAALQAALEGEHAAVFAYGVVGARAASGRRAEALAAYEDHLARRDRLIGLLSEAGEQPVEAEAAYAVPVPLRGPADAARLAALVEDRLCVTYAGLVADSDGDVRVLAAQLLQGCAVRAARWRGGLVRPFPGDPSRR